MATKYLSPDGLSYFWSQIKARLGAITTDISNISTKLNDQRVVRVDCGSFSSLPKTVTDSNVKAADEVIEAVLSNPGAQTGDWTVTTSAGSLTISGTISGTTSLTLYLTVPE